MDGFETCGGGKGGGEERIGNTCGVGKCILISKRRGKDMAFGTIPGEDENEIMKRNVDISGQKNS